MLSGQAAPRTKPQRHIVVAFWAHFGSRTLVKCRRACSGPAKDKKCPQIDLDSRFQISDLLT